MSSRLMFLMLSNSSFIAASDCRMIWMSSFLPLGEYLNGLRKLSAPLTLLLPLTLIKRVAYHQKSQPSPPRRFPLARRAQRRARGAM